MNVICKALPPEHSDARFLIFDMPPEFIEMLREYRQLIKDTPLLQRNDFLGISLIQWGCAVIESIDEGEACDGLIQAKWKVENDELEFVYLDDSVDIKTGVTDMRTSVSTLTVSANQFTWEIILKYEDGAVLSPPMDISHVEIET